MRSRNVTRSILAVGLAVSIQLALGQIPSAQQGATQAPAADGAPQPGRGGGRGAVDSRVQQRTYMFAETNEQMPYALFVSSKVTKDKKNPLIVVAAWPRRRSEHMVRESLAPSNWRNRVATFSWLRWATTPRAGTGIPPGPPRGAERDAARYPVPAWEHLPQPRPPERNVAPERGARRR